MNSANLIDCADGSTYTDDLRSGKACKFDHKALYGNTPCSEEKQYSYNTNKPCVLLKLNKMIDFIPESDNTTDIKIVCIPDNVRKKELMSEILKMLHF